MCAVSQLSVAEVESATASAIREASLHSSVASSEPAAVVITGAVLSLTLIVCVKLNALLPLHLQYPRHRCTQVLHPVNRLLLLLPVRCCRFTFFPYTTLFRSCCSHR